MSLPDSQPTSALTARWTMSTKVCFKYFSNIYLYVQQLLITPALCCTNTTFWWKKLRVLKTALISIKHTSMRNNAPLLRVNVDCTWSIFDFIFCPAHQKGSGEVVPAVALWGGWLVRQPEIVRRSQSFMAHKFTSLCHFKKWPAMQPTYWWYILLQI